MTPVAGHGSPYSARSLFACNTLLLSPELLVKEGYIPELPPGISNGSESAVDFTAALEFKSRLAEMAFAYSYSRVRLEEDYSRFRERNSYWLDDFALYDAIAREQGRPWYEWPEPLRLRDQVALNEKLAKLRSSVESMIFSQYLFERQWSSLASYARYKRVKIMGDVPFYVLHDSADVWAHRELFKVDQQGRGIFVGGVPPDYFSKTGQRWGNPVYDWKKLEETGYAWWSKRVARNLEYADFLRLDHFRGYVAYWEIPAEKETAVEGQWVEIPTTFLPFVESSFPSLPFVAEDLGVITEDVVEARERLGIPGMRVLQFAFDGTKDNTHLPRNYSEGSFVYTSTHDTNTARGWFEQEASSKEKELLAQYFGHELTSDKVAGEMIGAVMSSAAEASVIPMQDILGLGGEARMNNPATSSGNWKWRVTEKELAIPIFARMGEETAACGRADR